MDTSSRQEVFMTHRPADVEEVWFPWSWADGPRWLQMAQVTGSSVSGGTRFTWIYWVQLKKLLYGASGTCLWKKPESSWSSGSSLIGADVAVGPLPTRFTMGRTRLDPGSYQWMFPGCFLDPGPGYETSQQTSWRPKAGSKLWPGVTPPVDLTWPHGASNLLWTNCSFIASVSHLSRVGGAMNHFLSMITDWWSVKRLQFKTRFNLMLRQLLVLQTHVDIL